MFENVDGRTDGRTDGQTDGRRTTDAGVTGILLAHLRAFGSGELKSGWGKSTPHIKHNNNRICIIFLLQ